MAVFRQIYMKREYACLDDLKNVRFIIDCGANVGYSSAYFLSRYPTSEVIAIEPDAHNFALLQLNTAAYGHRVRVIHAGVWSSDVRLVMSDVPYRDGREWSRQVRVCQPGEAASLEGIHLGSLLATSRHDRISLLKIDVEGAEAVIFSENYQSWLNKVDNIVIELHDDSCFGSASDAFFSAIGGQGFEVSRSGELTVCRRSPDDRTAPVAGSTGA